MALLLLKYRHFMKPMLIYRFFLLDLQTSRMKRWFLACCSLLFFTRISSLVVSETYHLPSAHKKRLGVRVRVHGVLVSSLAYSLFGSTIMSIVEVVKTQLHCALEIQIAGSLWTIKMKSGFAI